MFDTLNIIEKTLKRQHYFLIFSTILSLVSLTVLSICFFVYTHNSKRTVYAIDNAGNAILLRETGEDPVSEARAQFQDFHRLFFSFPPDGKQIEQNIALALNLADQSALVYYNTFKESHYYNKLIAASASQSIQIDSVIINNQHPYQAKLFAKIYLIRSSMIVEKSLIATGQLRRTQRSANVPHGFLIEKYQIVELKDLKTYTR